MRDSHIRCSREIIRFRRCRYSCRYSFCLPCRGPQGLRSLACWCQKCLQPECRSAWRCRCDCSKVGQSPSVHGWNLRKARLLPCLRKLHLRKAAPWGADGKDRRSHPVQRGQDERRSAPRRRPALDIPARLLTFNNDVGHIVHARHPARPVHYRADLAKGLGAHRYIIRSSAGQSRAEGE